ncbi:hypothetical protein, partial [Mesorhizobium sp. M5C.F.Ca.IN.020.29.1.1]|uniref:hypothetical protein n=1 Tax=Mesorhizobium sp. M5C.F.Ca.IN.020.29.1.1 TaxID=2496770 RepID=UPI0013DF3C3F
MAAPASKKRERRANFSIIILIVPCFVDLSSRPRLVAFSCQSTVIPEPVVMATFIQFRLTISGGFKRGNEHLQSCWLDQISQLPPPGTTPRGVSYFNAVTRSA